MPSLSCHPSTLWATVTASPRKGWGLWSTREVSRAVLEVHQAGDEGALTGLLTPVPHCNKAGEASAGVRGWEQLCCLLAEARLRGEHSNPMAGVCQGSGQDPGSWGCSKMLPHAVIRRGSLLLSPGFLVARLASALGEGSGMWHKPATPAACQPAYGTVCMLPTAVRRYRNAVSFPASRRSCRDAVPPERLALAGCCGVVWACKGLVRWAHPLGGTESLVKRRQCLSGNSGTIHKA